MSIVNLFATDTATILRTVTFINAFSEQVCTENTIYTWIPAQIYKNRWANKFSVTDKERMNHNHSYKIILDWQYNNIEKKDMISLTDTCNNEIWKYCVEDIQCYQDTCWNVSHIELSVSYSNEI